MSWNSVVGQERVKRILRTAFEAERIPHALLFHGPEGVGKDAVALALARTLNCEARTWEPCGTCHNCRMTARLQHPQVKLVFPLPAGRNEKAGDDPYEKLSDETMSAVRADLEEKAANPYHRIGIPKASEIRINSIRDIRRDAILRTGGGNRSVVIISGAHAMNDEASNALLKTLEEPTGELLLLLTTHRKNLLRPTIVSRCQQLLFDPLPEEKIVRALAERFEFPHDQLLVIAKLSNGSFGRALELAGEDIAGERQRVVEFLRAVWTQDPVDLMKHIQPLHDAGDRAAVADFLAGLQWWFRDIRAIQEGFGDRIVNVDLQGPLHNFAEHFPSVDSDKVIKILDQSIEFTQKNSHIALVLIHVAQEIHSCLSS